jgi:hypothetical protein
MLGEPSSPTPAPAPDAGLGAQLKFTRQLERRTPDTPLSPRRQLRAGGETLVLAFTHPPSTLALIGSEDSELCQPHRRQSPPESAHGAASGGSGASGASDAASRKPLHGAVAGSVGGGRSWDLRVRSCACLVLRQLGLGREDEDRSHISLASILKSEVLAGQVSRNPLSPCLPPLGMATRRRA